MQKYTLSVASVFKNEEQNIQEWIEHYLNRGVEHFFLINDNSNDNFLEKIQCYIDNDIITLYNAKYPYYLGRQSDMYNKYILPLIKESKWFLIVDMDEFMWCTKYKNMNIMLNQCNHIGQFQVEHTIFGSNGHISQPKSIVEGFTKRSKEISSSIPIGNRKYFINTNYDFLSLGVHHAHFMNKKYDKNPNVFMLLESQYFRLNHYSCQSLEFWKNIKCTRGDADNYFNRKIEDFVKYDINEVEDFDLVNQNLQ